MITNIMVDTKFMCILCLLSKEKIMVPYDL